MNDLNKKLILSFLIVFFLGTVALFTLREATESKIQNLNVVSSVPSFELVNSVSYTHLPLPTSDLV